MSKVYEALRQKEHEISTDLGGDISIDAELAGTFDSGSGDSEFGLSDRVLRVALAAAESDQKSQVKPASPFRNLPQEGERGPVSPDGFRRLKLASAENSRLVFQTDPHGMAAEQFRFLRRTLEQKFPRGGVLLVTSPAPRDGKTLTTVNLCSCLADSGRSTILLEGDIRQPSIRRVLGGTNAAPGIEHVLAGTVDPVEAVHYVEELKLHVSMVVDPPPDPSNMVSGNGTKSLLAWARERFHWVVIDSPPVLPAADVTQLAALADATLLVVRAQSTPRDLVARACELLGDHLFGVVLNEATVESNPYYRYLSEYRQKVAAPSRREASRGNGLDNPSRPAADTDSIGARLR